MAGKQLLEYVPFTALGVAVGYWFNERREEDALVDNAFEMIKELQSSTSTLESAATEWVQVGGNLCSALSAASFGLLVCGGLILAFLYKGGGGDGGRSPHGGGGDHN